MATMTRPHTRSEDAPPKLGSTDPAAERGFAGAGDARPGVGKKIWIDLDNTPHVPFFAPIIEELERRGCSICLTARAAFQVCELADLYHLDYARIGRHYGKRKALKVIGLGVRALQLVPFALDERPDLAISHGSRPQLLVAALLGIPSVLILDYEFARALLRPTWVMAPEVIPATSIAFPNKRLRRYPGIKEDVYAPRFRPDGLIRVRLGLGDDQVIATVRPPANEAHYHNPQSEDLFRVLIEFLMSHSQVKIVLLPRNSAQAACLRRVWPAIFAGGQAIIPEGALDGLNLIWHSDLVISGGGTMNREAAALGVPVYSIFRGKIGAVDRYLAEQRRLVLLETPQDVRTKIVLKRRPRPALPAGPASAALRSIVEGLLGIVASGRRAMPGAGL